MLPNAVRSTVLPATRMMNSSPRPRPNRSSGGTRLSEQTTSTANGFCPPPLPPPRTRRAPPPPAPPTPPIPALHATEGRVGDELLVALLEQRQRLIGRQVRTGVVGC